MTLHPCVIVDKLDKLTKEEIDTELPELGVPSQAIDGILKALTLQSFDAFEGGEESAGAEVTKIFLPRTESSSHRLLRQCDNLKEERLVLLGTTQWEQGKVSVKDLNAREQTLKTVNEFIASSCGDRQIIIQVAKEYAV